MYINKYKYSEMIQDKAYNLPSLESHIEIDLMFANCSFAPAKSSFASKYILQYQLNTQCEVCQYLIGLYVNGTNRAPY
jgi:predicted solute-binding protein